MITMGGHWHFGSLFGDLRDGVCLAFDLLSFSRLARYVLLVTSRFCSRF